VICDNPYNCRKISKKPSIKNVRTKLWKIDLPFPFSEKCLHWPNPLPSYRCGHTTNFLKNPTFFAPKSANVRIWRTSLVYKIFALDISGQPLPLNAGIFNGQPVSPRNLLFEVFYRCNNCVKHDRVNPIRLC